MAAIRPLLGERVGSWAGHSDEVERNGLAMPVDHADGPRIDCRFGRVAATRNFERYNGIVRGRIGTCSGVSERDEQSAGMELGSGGQNNGSREERTK